VSFPPPFPSSGRRSVARNAAGPTGTRWAAERNPRGVRAAGNVGRWQQKRERACDRTRKGHERGMTVAVTAAGPMRNPPDTANRIPPPPDPPSVTTATADAGRPDVLIDPGLCWPPVACQGMGDWPFFGPDTEHAVFPGSPGRPRQGDLRVVRRAAPLSGLRPAHRAGLGDLGWSVRGGTRAGDPRPRPAGPAHHPRRPGEFTGGRVPCPLMRSRSRPGASVQVETGTRR
jgi:hypothetical protein